MFDDDDSNNEKNPFEKLLTGMNQRVDYYGEEFEAIDYEPGDYETFGRLLLDTAFNGNIKEGTPDDKRRAILDEIAAVAFIRGVVEFMKDVHEQEGDLARILNAYGGRASSLIQDTANSLFAAVDEGEGYDALTEGDKKVHDFLRAKGVHRMRDRVGGLADMLKQMAEAMGVDPERLEKIKEAAMAGEATPGCNCERCQGIRAKASENGEGAPQEDEAPAPTASL